MSDNEAIEPVKIFVQANNFVLAYHVLASQPRDWLAATSYASMVISAFAAELYMKTLLALEEKAIPRQHNLEKLFDLISAERKIRIEHYWDRQIAKHENRLRAAERDLVTTLPRDLATALKVGANSFEVLRYAYEEPASRNTFILGELPACLREAIGEIKPEWQSLTGDASVMEGSAR